MAPKAEQHAETAAPSVPDITDDLADMLRRGRVAGPTAVASVEFRLADGRRIGMDLPAPRDATEDEGGADPVTDMQAAVIQAVNEMASGEVLTREQIADRAGYACNGKLKDFVALLAATGKLRRVHRGFERVS